MGGIAVNSIGWGRFSGEGVEVLAASDLGSRLALRFEVRGATVRVEPIHVSTRRSSALLDPDWKAPIAPVGIVMPLKVRWFHRTDQADVVELLKAERFPTARVPSNVRRLADLVQRIDALVLDAKREEAAAARVETGTCAAVAAAGNSAATKAVGPSAPLASVTPAR